MRQTTIIFSLLLLVCMIACTQDEKKKSYSDIPVVIGTYTQKEGHVDGKAKGLYIYSLDTISGKLDYRSTVEGIVNPSYVASNKDKIVAASEVSPGKIVYFQFKEDSLVNRIAETSSYGEYPCHVSISADGKYAFIANYGTGNVAAYALGGELKMLDTAKHSGSGITARQTSPHAHMIVQHPRDHEKVLAVDLGSDKIFVYDFKEEKLTLDYTVNMEPGAGPRQLTFHPFLDIIYVLNELNGTVSVITKGTSQQYEVRAQLTLLPESDSEDKGGADIQISPDGNYLYASVRGGVDKIFIVAIDDKGQLELIDSIKSGGLTPRAIKIDPWGKYLFSLNQDSGNITSYRIGEDGKLTTTANTKVPTPVSMDFLF